MKTFLTGSQRNLRPSFLAIQPRMHALVERCAFFGGCNRRLPGLDADEPVQVMVIALV